MAALAVATTVRPDLVRACESMGSALARRGLACIEQGDEDGYEALVAFLLETTDRFDLENVPAWGAIGEE